MFWLFCRERQLSTCGATEASHGRWRCKSIIVSFSLAKTSYATFSKLLYYVFSPLMWGHLKYNDVIQHNFTIVSIREEFLNQWCPAVPRGCWCPLVWSTLGFHMNPFLCLTGQITITQRNKCNLLYTKYDLWLVWLWLRNCGKRVASLPLVLVWSSCSASLTWSNLGYF